MTEATSMTRDAARKWLVVAPLTPYQKVQLSEAFERNEVLLGEAITVLAKERADVERLERPWARFQLWLDGSLAEHQPEAAECARWARGHELDRRSAGTHPGAGSAVARGSGTLADPRPGHAAQPSASCGEGAGVGGPLC